MSLFFLFVCLFFLQLFLQNVGVVAVAASFIPLILIPVIPLLLIFLYLRRFYLRTSQDVKRLESTSTFCVFPPSLCRMYEMQKKKKKVKVKEKMIDVFFLCLIMSPAARSPVFSHLSSSLQGLCTIRAFRAQERLKKAFDAHQDLHSGYL